MRSTSASPSPCASVSVMPSRASQFLPPPRLLINTMVSAVLQTHHGSSLRPAASSILTVSRTSAAAFNLQPQRRQVAGVLTAPSL
ncbi:hypothetical protein M0R45_019345 [Rubus argutus]|uniref:Uncharacterized protein n=1 Tax=Rubus argutus TaxID=59490 RepID=A0AAW1X6T7_RUBAR